MVNDAEQEKNLNSEYWSNTIFIKSSFEYGDVRSGANLSEGFPTLH